jgi:uncharacterized protein (DUF1501 family)
MKRRSFLKNSALGAFVPAFFENYSFLAAGNLNETLLENDNVLVIIQLNGGNDGLNTVIPISNYGTYKAARTNIAIDEAKLLRIPQTKEIGLHPSLKGLWELMSNGAANLIQDVGYPNPNYSHFRATDIWNTAANSNEFLESGWTGRYLALKHPNFPEGYPNTKYPDPLAVQIGSIVNPALQGPLFGMGMSIASTDNFYQLLDDKEEQVPNTLAGKELNFLRQVAKQTNSYSGTIKNAALKVTKQVTYPNLSLANQLKIVARLIGGGLKTKIYYVNLGGFDTHSNQVDAADTTKGTHANLLANLSDSIKAFQDDLKFLGVSDKVLGLTYSEFGRRIKSNGSSGTDHGAAAPMFMFGEKVNPVYLGKPTPISATVGNNDNIVMQYDFRSVYSSILKDWFCSSDADLTDTLLRSHQALDLVSKSVCGSVLANEPVQNEADKLNVFPNPFSDFFNISFESKGGIVRVEIYAMNGQQIAVPVEAEFASGSHTVPYDGSKLRTGSYMIRFQNQDYQNVKRVIKL